LELGIVPDGRLDEEATGRDIRATPVSGGSTGDLSLALAAFCAKAPILPVDALLAIAREVVGV